MITLKHPLTFCVDPSFQRELHRLLWMAPSSRQGDWDPGWSCRDHAFLLACMLRKRKVECVVVHGKAMYVFKGTPDSSPVGIGQDASARAMHAWLTVPTIGIVDISPRLSDLPSRVGALSFSGVVGELLPASSERMLVVADNQGSFENAVALATHREGLSGIYWPMSHLSLDAATLSDPFASINSPLCDLLLKRYESNVYLKAVLHLLGFLEGKRRSLVGVSQNKAWAIVSTISNAETELLQASLNCDDAA